MQGSRQTIRFGQGWHQGIWGGLCLLLMMGCQQKTRAIHDIEASLSANEQQDYVVLLHGMWRNAYAMSPMEEYLAAKGYQVINISYPSTQYPIETLVEQYLHPIIQQLQPNRSQKIHFVTHSMGGILVRYYLKHYQISSIGRVVMLSPPNQGTELADIATESDWYQGTAGPSGRQLGTQPGSLTKQLGAVEFELGVIAGNKSNWTTSLLIPGPDDGVVAVESTKVQGMRDFMLVSEKHYNLRGLKQVFQQVVYFLENGQFFHLTT